MENLVTMGDLTIKIYNYRVKKRYLNGKYVYVYERSYVPIPTQLQHKARAYFNQRLKIELTEQNNKLVVILSPVKTFSHTKIPPDKT